ncbi:hypothetical protein [Nocardia nova]|uniref:hypothetical protein n=1 Tax=Nocardia nova TaxID=37330 RepID=UPI0033D3D008
MAGIVRVEHLGWWRTATVAVVGGTLLICWVLGDMAVRQSLSWLQPVYLIAGVAVVALGLRIRTVATGLRSR